MAILLLGAGGFIGSAIARSLAASGKDVIGLGRDCDWGKRILPEIAWVHGDLRDKTQPEAWRDTLKGVEVVINAAGALQSGLRDNVDLVQRDAMLALYTAAKDAGVAQVIQISAASADEQADSAFMGTKAKADEALAASGITHCILRPGLVIGRNSFGGNELLRSAAAFPMAGVDISGTGTIQSVALSDVVAAVHAALDDPDKARGSFDLVEREGRSLGEVIAHHRTWLGLSAPNFTLRMPLPLVRIMSVGADLLGWLGWRSPMRSNAIAALVHGVKGNADDAHGLLGRDVTPLPETLLRLGVSGKADRWHARIAGIFPLALASLILLWLVSGLLGLCRTDEAASLLVAGGMEQGLARLCVIGGSVADLALAAGLLFRPWTGKALLASLLLALSYVAGSLLFRADLWLDPLGPMLKVLPILALTAFCLAIAEER